MVYFKVFLFDSDQKMLVFFMYVNNEIGILIDLEGIVVLCQEYGVFFYFDIVQVIGYYLINVFKMLIVFLIGVVYKFYGLKGVGFVYINGDNVVKFFIDGGVQECNMWGGIENIYGILGMVKVLQLAYVELLECCVKIIELCDYLCEQLEVNFDDLEFNGDV